MSIRVNNGYLLKMNLEGAYRLCQRLGEECQNLARVRVASRMAWLMIEGQDLKKVLGREVEKTYDFTGAWIETHNRHRKVQQERQRDPAWDMETEVFMRPFPRGMGFKDEDNMVLCRFQTEQGDVQKWWEAQKGVSPFRHDGCGGPEDDEQEEEAYAAWKKRGEVWSAWDDQRFDLTFVALGNTAFPIPSHKDVARRAPPFEKRVENAARTLVDYEWASNKKSSGLEFVPSEYFEWRTSDEGKATMAGAIERVRRILNPEDQVGE